MAIALPPGVKVSIELPPYSDLPNQSQEQLDINALIVAAMSTPHYPVAKQQALQLINKSVSAYRYVRPTNRAQRRNERRANSKTHSKKGRM